MANLKHISFQLQDQHSSSTESTSLSHQEFTVMGKTSSQDQCASSDSVHDESYGKHGQDMKAALFMCNTELSINASQAEIIQPIVQFPYPYTDPYFSGLFTAYGPQNMPQVMAAASGRVPLPADLPEDGPIYVNAKQYHGILRRRQTRAKLEAQNKLVKTRKPYLHESRHQHALNRVRGSGGRFLSTKKNHHQHQQSDSDLPPSGSENIPQDSFLFNHQKMNMLNNSTEHRMETDNGEGTRVSTGDVVVHAVPMQNNGGFVYNGNRHYASIVR